MYVPSRRETDLLQSIYYRALFALGDPRSVLKRSEGQALIEYALIISLIAVVTIGALSAAGVNIKSLLNRVAGEV
jgi:Flp pilus assembly pilin Flp